jgi:hypothetical protein
MTPPTLPEPSRTTRRNLFYTGLLNKMSLFLIWKKRKAWASELNQHHRTRYVISKNSMSTSEFYDIGMRITVLLLLVPCEADCT